MCGWGMGGSSFLSSDCLLALSCAPYALKKPCSEKMKHKIGTPCDAVHVLQYVTELFPVTAMLFEKEPYFLTSSYPTQSSTDIYF